MTDPSVVFIDDDPHIRQAIVQALTLEDMSVQCYGESQPGLAAISPEFEGVVLCDYNMPCMDALVIMERIQAMDESIPVVILTGQGDISTAVTAMQRGAYDFIEKPFDHDALVELLRHALEKRHLALENRRLKAQLRHFARPGPRILGDSPAMRKVVLSIDPLLDNAANVLLRGETGSGKDAIARYIHENSNRSDHNFVAINCGAVPENLIESELFGHEKGAFTGADKRRIGKIEHAQGGTLFLDEIESMPMLLQVKLLRVLEEQRVERLGSNQEIDVDVRVITATKSDLLSLSEQGEFRSDLYYRLNVVEIAIPPLRERGNDIPMLFHHFVLIAASRYGRESIPLNASQAARLIRHDWPGNVRELRNLAERYVLLGPSALDDSGSDTQTNITGRETLGEMMDGFERSLLVSALNDSQGSIKDTMVRLGIARKTLYEKMKKHGLDKSDFKA